jgi:ADP-ribose pyrophosphatase YjhB (NUDIX family)
MTNLPLDGVSVVIRDEKSGKIVLIRHRQFVYDKTLEAPWALPGGGIEQGQTPQQAAQAEVSEETELGFDQSDFHLVGTFIQMVKREEGYVDGTLYLFEVEADYLEGYLPEDTPEADKLGLFSLEEVYKKLPEIGLGYLRQILKYLRCQDGTDERGFSKIRLSEPVAYERWGIVDRTEVSQLVVRR